MAADASRYSFFALSKKKRWKKRFLIAKLIFLVFAVNVYYSFKRNVKSGIRPVFGMCFSRCRTKTTWKDYKGPMLHFTDDELTEDCTSEADLPPLLAMPITVTVEKSGVNASISSQTYQARLAKQEKKLAFALSQIIEYEPDFQYEVGKSPGNAVIIGTDVIHLESILSRIRNVFGVECTPTGPATFKDEHAPTSRIAPLPPTNTSTISSKPALSSSANIEAEAGENVASTSEMKDESKAERSKIEQKSTFDPDTKPEEKRKSTSKLESRDVSQQKSDKKETYEAEDTEGKPASEDVTKTEEKTEVPTVTKSDPEVELKATTITEPKTQPIITVEPVVKSKSGAGDDSSVKEIEVEKLIGKKNVEQERTSKAVSKPKSSSKSMHKADAKPKPKPKSKPKPARSTEGNEIPVVVIRKSKKGKDDEKTVKQREERDDPLDLRSESPAPSEPRVFPFLDEENELDEKWTDEKNRKTRDAVLDERTAKMLSVLQRKGYFSQLAGSIKRGKESSVFLARCDNSTLRAIKIYRTNILNYGKRHMYVNGDRRLRREFKSSANSAKFAKVWAEKEFRNLKRLRFAGVPCPVPYGIHGHVVVMEFIGHEGEGVHSSAFTLRELKASTAVMKQLYISVVESLCKMFRKAGLVHADLSEYNLIYDPNKNDVKFIDVGQAVVYSHPMAYELLRRDVQTLNKFFQKKRILTLTDKALFMLVTDPEVNGREYVKNYIKVNGYRAGPVLKEINDRFASIEIPQSYKHLVINEEIAMQSHNFSHYLSFFESLDPEVTMRVLGDGHVKRARNPEKAGKLTKTVTMPTKKGMVDMKSGTTEIDSAEALSLSDPSMEQLMRESKASVYGERDDDSEIIRFRELSELSEKESRKSRKSKSAKKSSATKTREKVRSKRMNETTGSSGRTGTLLHQQDLMVESQVVDF